MRIRSSGTLVGASSSSSMHPPRLRMSICNVVFFPSLVISMSGKSTSSRPEMVAAGVQCQRGNGDDLGRPAPRCR